VLGSSRLKRNSGTSLANFGNAPSTRLGNNAEYPSFVQSLYDVLCKHHSQQQRVAHTTNTTQKYRAIPLRSCSSKTIASFYWNGTASGIGSPHRPLSKQSRPQVHRKQARDHQQRHPYPLQHQQQRSERGTRLLKQLLCGIPYRLLQSCATPPYP
jgi:hypothetical protein